MSNFLERGAIKRATKSIKHQMHAGEVILEFDICELGGRGRADLLLSDRALYLIAGGRADLAVRLPLEDISDVIYQPENRFYRHVLVVKMWDGSAFQFFAKASWRALPSILAQRVPDRLVARHRIDLYAGGRGVGVRQLKGREWGTFEWAYDVDDGVDEQDAVFVRDFDTKMLALIAAHK